MSLDLTYQHATHDSYVVRAFQVGASGREDFGLFAHLDGYPASPSTIAAALGETFMEKIASLPSNHQPDRPRCCDGNVDRSAGGLSLAEWVSEVEVETDLRTW
jgi:hypothetical protein